MIDWTEQGVRNFKDTVDRYEAASGQLEARGVSFEEMYWTLGAHDIVSVIEAPDDETLAAGLLAVAGPGNIRTTTLTVKWTGKRIEDTEVHLWTFGADGKVVALRHFVDTLQHAEAQSA